jgi:cytochrome c biogenesis protein CcmG, thiol:disulfide interchange protein DsbE
MKKTGYWLLLMLLAMPPLHALEIGDRIPPLLGRTLDGKLYRLEPGQPMVINFFWVECAPCVQELPELARLAQRTPNVTFIAVHVEEAEIATVRDFIARLRAAPPTIVVGSPRIKENYAIAGLPYTLLVDRHGVVQLRLQGYSKAGIAQLQSALKRY